MAIILIIAAAVLAAYVYATVAYYYAFRNWVPFCAVKSSDCTRRKSPK